MINSFTVLATNLIKTLYYLKQSRNKQPSAITKVNILQKSIENYVQRH
jgi:hypothetical protein